MSLRRSRDSRDKAKKAMRLGTKSCLECRRRKVRCIFLPNIPHTCQQCVLHRCVCQPQGQIPASPVAIQYPATPAASEPSRYLLDELSGSVSQASLRDFRGGEGPFEPDQQSQSSRGGGGQFEGAPLMTHLRASSQLAATSSSANSQRNLPAAPCSLRGLVPHPTTLDTIFRFTQPFWSIWPLASNPEIGPDAQSHLFPTNVSEANAFIDSHVYHVSDDIQVAKGLTFLSLCIQQLPVEMLQPGRLEPGLPLPAPDLVDRLLEEGQRLVRESFDSDHGHLEAIEVSVVQFKCFVNMGQPRKAWKTCRAAIDCALLSGFHRTTDEKKRQLWLSLWNQDRQMSLILGLPYSISDSLIDLGEPEEKSMPAYAQVLTRICRINRRIIDRDQAADKTPYSVTTQIGEDLDELKHLLPDGGRLTYDNEEVMTTPAGPLFWRRASIFFFHYTNHLLHLPYLLKGRSDPKYLHSRQITLASAEAMLLVYMKFPNPRGVHVICDFLDFAAFSGALTVVTECLASDGDTNGIPNSQKQDTQEEKHLWRLIMDVSKYMRQKADVLGSPVPTQSAQVLEYLYAARQGMYKEPEDYAVVIPFFGKICIRRPTLRATQLGTGTPKSPSCLVAAAEQNTLPSTIPCDSQITTVEFNTNLCGPRVPGHLSTATNLELGADWVHDVRMDDVSWDWTGVFDFDTLCT